MWGGVWYGQGVGCNGQGRIRGWGGKEIKGIGGGRGSGVFSLRRTNLQRS